MLTLSSGRGEELGIGALHQVLHELKLPFLLRLATPLGLRRAVEVPAAAIGTGDADRRVVLADLLYMLCNK